MRARKSALLAAAAAISLASGIAHAGHTEVIGAVVAEDAVGNAMNSTGTFMVSGTPILNQITVSGTYTNAFTGECAIRLTAPDTTQFDISLDVTAAADLEFSTTGVWRNFAGTAPMDANGMWTYQVYDRLADPGTDWTAPDLTIQFVDPLPTPYTDNFFNYVQTTSTTPVATLSGIRSGPNLINATVGFMEAQAALASPVVFGANSPLSRDRSSWTADGFANIGTTNALRVNITGTTADEWIISPMFALNPAATYNLTFSLAHTTAGGTGATVLGADDRFSILMSDDGGVVWRNTGGQELMAFTSATPISNTGQTVSIPISGVGGNRRFAFAGFSTVANVNSDMHIDNFNFFEVVPFNVDVVSLDPSLAINEGTTVHYTFSITNNGSSADTFSVGAPNGTLTTGYFMADMATPFASPFGLAAGASTTLEVRVFAPLGSDNGVIDTEIVSVTGLGGSSDMAQVQTLSVNPTGAYVQDNSANAFAQPSFPAYSFVDISGTGTDVWPALNDDGFVGPFPIGFNFTFFNNIVTQYWIDDNGWITFNDPTALTDATERTNVAVRTAGGLNNYIAGWWDDMNADDTDYTAGTVHVYRGPGGPGEEVVTFERYPVFNGTAGPPTDFVSFQIILNDSPDGNIRIQYQEFGATLPLNTSSIGIEDSPSFRGLQHIHNGVGAALLPAPFALEFSTNMNNLPVELSGIELE